MTTITDHLVLTYFHIICFFGWLQELLKLRKKITSTVQVLTHLKEKLQYVQAENQVQKRNLREVEAEVGQVRHPIFFKTCFPKIKRYGAVQVRTRIS